jgi:uncharacterized membrane protein
MCGALIATNAVRPWVRMAELLCLFPAGSHLAVQQEATHEVEREPRWHIFVRVQLQDVIVNLRTIGLRCVCVCV